jgi:hypothetical protein
MECQFMLILCPNAHALASSPRDRESNRRISRLMANAVTIALVI